MAAFESDKEKLVDSAYSSGMLTKFKQFRDEEAFCDYVIKVNEREFKVSTLLLLIILCHPVIHMSGLLIS